MVRAVVGVVVEVDALDARHINWEDMRRVAVALAKQAIVGGVILPVCMTGVPLQAVNIQRCRRYTSLLPSGQICKYRVQVPGPLGSIGKSSAWLGSLAFICTFSTPYLPTTTRGLTIKQQNNH